MQAIFSCCSIRPVSKSVVPSSPYREQKDALESARNPTLPDTPAATATAAAADDVQEPYESERTRTIRSDGYPG